MKLYAIIIRETGQLLNAETFEKHWKNYGQNNLYGWRPPKKVYETIGRAKAGFSHIPEEIKQDCDIATLKMDEIVVNGEVLKEEQAKAREKREAAYEEKMAKYKLERAEKEMARAKLVLDLLKKND